MFSWLLVVCLQVSYSASQQVTVVATGCQIVEMHTVRCCDWLIADQSCDR